VLGTDEICKYLLVSVSSYVEVCLCLLAAMLIRVVMFGCIIAGSLCSILSVLSCVAVCCVSFANFQLLK